MKIGSMFTGYGGLDLSVQLAVPGAVVAWVAEYEPPTEKNLRPSQGAARLLAHHHPDIPNLGDVSTVDWDDVERVDIVTGGFPCTDISPAGLRAGLREGTRSGLWYRMADAIRALRPRLVLIENVRGILSADAHCDVEPCPWCVGDTGDGESALRALGAVLGDLADLGYDAAWCGLRAADIGAPHARYRVFVLAWPSDPDSIGRGPDLAGVRQGEPDPLGCAAPDPGGETLRLWAGLRASEQGWIGWGRPNDNGCPDAAPDPDSERTGGDGRAVPREARAGGRPDVNVHPVGDARGDAAPDPGSDEQPEPDVRAATGIEAPPREDAARRVLDWGTYGPAITRWERLLGRPAPSPTQPGRNDTPRLSPAFVEWMMGLPAGHVTAVPGLTRNDQLKLLGNGVVPQQGTVAFRFLLGHVPAAVLRGIQW